MTTLLERLEADNARTIAWINEDPENRWATTWSTDLSYWAERGVTTAEEFDRWHL